MNIAKTQTDKIVVGTNDVSYVPPDISPTGTAVLNGPVYVGKTGASPGYQALLNITSNSAQQNPLNIQPACSARLAMKSDGNLTVAGDGKTPNALLISGGSSVDTIHVEGDMFVSGAVDCGNKGKLAARFGVADSKPKPFDLEHPTKGKGHRLRYACIEGPEVAVYCRGRLKESNVIELPYYWKDLVHEDSISVQLQPIGHHQNIIVKRWDSEFIYLQGQGGGPVNCFYHVYAERKDVNPLLTEYEGNSRYDYPDPNFSEKSDIPIEERNYTDPNYKFPRNTYTV